MSQHNIPNYLNFVFGGSAGMAAACIVQPLDLIKNRMQLSGVGKSQKEHKSSIHLMIQIVKKEGFFALYNGLSAGLLRQATYTTTRLGVYQCLDKIFSSPENPPTFLQKVGIGIAAGACGAFVGTPADVALIRMTADGQKPPEEKRNYKNVFDALFRIFREEKLAGLWRGSIPTMGRAMVVNVAQLSSYFQVKQFLLSTDYFTDNIMCHFTSSMISGLITTIASMPVDIAKTRIQNMKTVDGRPEFSGSFDVLSKVIRKEGVFALWKGFTPYFMRLGPHTILTLVFLEQFKAAYIRNFLE